MKKVFILSNRIEILESSEKIEYKGPLIVKLYNTTGFDINLLCRQFIAEKYEIINFAYETERVIQTELKIKIRKFKNNYYTIELED